MKRYKDGSDYVYTDEYLMRRIWDAQQTRGRLLARVADDPGSRHVSRLEARAMELELAITMWKSDLADRLERKG